MDIQKRQLSSEPSLEHWVHGGLNFGYGPTQYAMYFDTEWYDNILKSTCNETPIIAVSSGQPLFAPILGAAMKGVLGICISKLDDPVLLLAAEHASYIHRPGTVIVAEKAEEFIGLGEKEINAAINQRLQEMEVKANDIIEDQGGLSGFLSKNPRYIDSGRAAVILEKSEASLAIEYGLLLRYWLRKDVDILIPNISREDLPKEIRKFHRPDIIIGCRGEIFTGNRQVEEDVDRSELEVIVKGGSLNIRQTVKHDVLEDFVPSKNYFE